jgi:sugar phosphate isomerase/epimerase
MKIGKNILKQVQVNIPFTWLWERYADRFLQTGLNPEIGIDAAAMDRFSRADFAAMARRLLQRGLTVTIHGPFFDMCPGSLDPQVRAVTRKRFEQLLELVPLFEPKTVVMHAGYDWKRYGYVKGDWLENSLQTWRWMAERLKTIGSRLMLENVYESRPEELRPLFEQLAGRGVGMCLDTGHLSAFGKASAVQWVDAMADVLGQLHLHDNYGDRDQHLAMGTGSIDFAALFQRLVAVCPTPPVITLEPHEEDALEPSLSYLENIWPW